MRTILGMAAAGSVIILLYASSCNIIPDLTLLDWPIDESEIVIDTIPEDTCTNPIEYTQPDFITGFIIFDDPQDSVLWKGGNVQSYDLEDVLASVFPGMTYRIYRNAIAWMVIVEGTSDHHAAQLSVQCRVNGAKWYMGWSDQSILPVGVVTADEFSELIDLYPSINRFNFMGTSYDSIQYIDLAWKMIDCRLGRAWADFRHIPYDVPPEIIQAYEDAGWEKILHN